MLNSGNERAVQVRAVSLRDRTGCWQTWFKREKKNMVSVSKAVLLLCICHSLPSMRATNPIFFPCENNTDSTKVDCSERNLTDVPSILQSSSVLSLNLDRNNIQNLKRLDFAGVPQVQVLNISWNCPPGKLRALGVPPCHMQIDHSVFIDLKNLTRLYLAGNSLIQVPALPDCLEILSMEYNILFYISEPLRTPKLQQLLLSKNCYYANPCNQSFYIDEKVFHGLPKLQNLTLAYNNITEVPLGLPASLESLDLRENKISEINELVFANLTKLKNLNLQWNCQRCDHAARRCFPCANNSALKLHPRAFRNQVNITFLSLRGNSLRDLPEELFSNMRSLIYLDLSDNLLAYTIRNGTFFKGLKSVKTLNLIYNNEPLRTFSNLTLSPHISKMTSLKHLLLSGYFFNTLTLEGIKPLINLKHLEKIDLRMNFIHSSSIDIFKKMKALKHIILSQNKLDFIKDSQNSNFWQSDHPRLPVRDVMIIPPEIIKAEPINLGSDRNDEEELLNPEMQTFFTRYCNGTLFFDLSQNNILYLKETTLKGMEGVFCLDLSYNYLSESLNGNQFVPLKNVTYLNLSFNRIDLYYDDAFQEVRSTLKALDLSNNAFHFYMKGMNHRFELIKNLTFLEALSLADNNIGILISKQLNSSSLKYLFFAGNRLDIMWDAKGDQYICFFKELTNLTYLDISRNRLKYFSSAALGNLPQNLRSLKVSGNQVSYFPWANLANLTNLYNLNLSMNSLLHLSSDITFNSNLVILDLSHNRISHLPEVFFQSFSSLRSLFLSHNQLQLLNVQSLPLQLRSYLEKLTLHDNPFVCSCDATWLPDFLRSTPIHIPKLTTNFKCGFPESLLGKNVLSIDPRSCQDIFGSIGFSLSFILILLLTAGPLLKRLYGWDLWYCIQVSWAGHKGYSSLQSNSGQHDAFVVFDTKNEHVRDWVYNELVANLEDKGMRRFRLCLEERDWVPGIACIENLHNAVYKSKKTVFVLTNNGAVNGTLKQAFYMVQQRLLDENVDTAVLVLLDEAFLNMNYVRMRKRLCRKSVLLWPRTPNAHHFWNKMRSALASDNSHFYDRNINAGFTSQ